MEFTRAGGSDRVSIRRQVARIMLAAEIAPRNCSARAFNYATAAKRGIKFRRKSKSIVRPVFNQKSIEPLSSAGK